MTGYEGTDRRESDQIRDNVEQLAVGLLGPRRTKLEGGGRRSKEGIVHRVGALEQGQARIEHALANGIQTRLKLSERIVVAVIAAGAAIVVALVGG